jgi:pyruvate/2-oxoglutarate dehydrogenase complex dihydrolipoamide dehydrogenase (E3) component
MSESTGERLPDEVRRLIQPQDEPNRRLVERVHPPEWINPEPAERYHLVVLGAGTAGLVCAAGAAGLGARVALIERRLMGGDCLNLGCVPSKALLSAARAWHQASQRAGEFGVRDGDFRGDFSAVMERMRRLRADISPADSARRFRELGVDVFLGEGRFTGRNSIEVEGARLQFRRAVIATGGRPAAPPIPGLTATDYLTSETLFTLTDLPERFAVIGAGPIGCEMAQAFARFGSRVTLLDIAPRILIHEDLDAAATVQRALEHDGVALELGAQIERVETLDDGIALRLGGEPSTTRTITVDRLLVATGRRPTVDGLGLDAAAVRFSDDGVVVDDKLRTSNRRIYACGDVITNLRFTHLADAQARIVVQNALFLPTAKASALSIPWCTYTSPEVAHVGLCEQQLRERGIDSEPLTVSLTEVDRAVLDGEEDGFLTVHLRPGTDKILGATLVAAHAGDMIGELCLAVTHDIGLRKIASTIHPYPTQGEIIKKAADTWRRRRLTPRTKKFLRWWFRLTR